jgi:RNA polymerase sigma factor (sigma-70 family)
METLTLLVIAAQGGDLEAFEKIVGRFQGMAYASAYALLNDAQLAEDVAQEAFIEAYLDLPKLGEPAAFPGWFRRIVFKQSDRVTRGKHIPTMPLENAHHIPMADFSLAAFIEERERDERVCRAVEDLPDHERIVTLLFYSTGYALKDIAAFLEVPITTIKKRLHDARKHLKASLLETVRDSLHEQRQSIMDRFSDKVQLLIAIRMDDMGRVKALLDQNPMLVNIKMEREENRTQPYGWIGSGIHPLYEAARNGNTNMVQLLLDYGAVVQTSRYNALSGAAQFNHKEVVKLLLNRRAGASGRPTHSGVPKD